MVVGLGNDELGYLMSREDYEREKFSYERSMCVSKHAGEQVKSELLRMHRSPVAQQDLKTGGSESAK